MAELVIKMIMHFTNKIRISNASGASVVEPITIDGEDITVEGDLKAIAPGHLVTLEGEIRLANSRMPMVLTAKVINQELLPNNNRRMVLHLHEYDKSLWQGYLEALGQEQARVQKLLDKYKGTDE